MKRAAGIFFTDGKQVLLLQRRKDKEEGGTWALPAGKAHKDESYIQAAIRETKEETGLESIPGERFDTIEGDYGDLNFVCYMYKVQKPFTIKITDEHLDWKWLAFSDLKDFKLHSKFDQELPRYLKSIRSNQSFKEWCRTTDLIQSFLLH